MLDKLYKAENMKLALRRNRIEEKKKSELANALADSDEIFYYIAGYTSWRFPYGIKWEEAQVEVIE